MDTKVIIVEDDRIVRQGLVRIFSSQKAIENNIKLVGDVRDAAGLYALLKVVSTDVILLDMRLNSVRNAGIKVLSKIEEINKNKDEKIRVLILSAEVTDAELILDALTNGALGFMGKDIDEEILIQNLVDCHRGEFEEDFTSSKIDKTLAKHAKKQRKKIAINGDTLSKRELEVFKLFASGLTREEISKRLFIGLPTVDMHKGKIKEKTGLANEVLYLSWIYWHRNNWLSEVFKLNPAIQTSRQI